MKRTASTAALAHIRVSESLPAAIERELRAFDVDTVADQVVHMVFGDDAAAAYVGEVGRAQSVFLIVCSSAAQSQAEMARGVAHCMRIIDSLGRYSTGCV